MRALLLVGGLAAVTAACDAMPGGGGSPTAEPSLALSLDVSDVLDWGTVSSVRLTLENQGNATSGRMNVELYVPSWLEFSSVEPAGTEVSLLSSGPETRLMYRLGDPALEPGETRSIVQHVRVPPRRGAGTAADTAVDAAPPVPANRVLRARLVSPDGDHLGAEVRTVMPFRGAASGQAPPDVMAGADAQVRSDRVGPVQLGASVAELRAAVPTARDTSFTLGEGQGERGLSVPLTGGRAALALIVDDRVERIIVRDARVRTERGHGVGSTFQQLRQAYGNACRAAAAGGGTAVWFPNLPGISFAFDAPPPTPQDTAAAGAALPDDARVRELWVRRGVDRC